MAENNALKTKKSNKKFMVLSAIGIIMAVDAHSWTPLNLFASYIPYNSFFMPLFVFISGYFNKVDSETDLKSYVLKKTKRLLLPYVVFSLSLIAVEQLLNLILRGGIHSNVCDEVLYGLFAMIIGISDSIASPLWFVYSLFFVQIVYAGIKKILYKHWNSLVVFVVFCLINIGTIYIYKSFNPGVLVRIPLRCVFFIPFIELGIIFRERIEPALSLLKNGWNVVVLLALLILNMFRMMFLSEPNSICFPIQYFNDFPSPYIFTPLISSFVGITFWVIVVETVGETLYKNQVINYISENTLWVLGLHVLFFNLLNCILLFVNTFIVRLQDFSYSEVSWWYFWEPIEQFRFMYFAFGLAGPLLLKYTFDKVISAFTNRSENNRVTA